MKNYIWLIILFSNVLLAQNKNNLVFEKSIYFVEIQIENGKDYLELDKENKIQIVTKNINPVNMACMGRNLRRGDFNGVEHTSWIAIPGKEGLKDGKYSLTIRFKGKRGRLFQHQFLIPVI